MRRRERIITVDAWDYLVGQLAFTFGGAGIVFFAVGRLIIWMAPFLAKTEIIGYIAAVPAIIAGIAIARKVG